VIESLSRSYTNYAGQMIRSDSYFNLSGVTYSTDPYIGTANVNYYSTTYSYDEQGNQNRTVSPTGTIGRTVYDILGRALSTWIGTDDSHTGADWSPQANTGNMIEVSAYQYDNGGTGDNNLTQTTQFTSDPNATGHDSTTDRVTQYLYDWRDRQIAAKAGVLLNTDGTENLSAETDSLHRPITVSTIDNLGETLATFSFDGDGIALSDFANGVSLTTTSGNIVATVHGDELRSYSTAQYDEQGRTFRFTMFSVDPSSGHVSSDGIVSNTWFDHRGEVIKSATSGGAVSKVQYDGAGRTTKSFTTDGGGDAAPGATGNWADALTVTGDIVLNQVEYTYDADGNVLMVTNRERFHDATTSQTGELGDPSSTGSTAKARVSYSLSYYDLGNRTIASVNVGTNGGVADDSAGGLDLVTEANSDGIPDVLQGSVPTRSDTVLVTSYAYNAAGENDTVTDPRGITSKTFYDNLGRTLFSVAAWDGTYDPTTGALPPSDSADQTTGYTYDGNGHTLTLTAIMPAGENSQTTQYVYGVSTSRGSLINSNDVLALVKYPDKSTGEASSSASDQNSFTYSALGATLTKTDQNGTLHTYSYDILGRMTSDAVTIASGNPQNVDNSILRIEMSYNSQGNVYQVTSYDASNGGNVVNQVQREYNGLGQMITEYQSHSGAVNIATTLKVQYGYDTMAHGSRIISMTYPNNTVLSYNYGSSGSLNDTISRLDSLSENSQTLEGYQYLGYGTVVVRSHPEDGIDLTYVQQTGDTLMITDGGDQYTGFDRFGRVIDQNWVNTNTGTSVDRYQYAYDHDSNRTAKNNLVAEATTGVGTSLDETYAYENLNRLSGTTRGGSSYQSWNLDALGNMDSVTTSGTTEDRTYNSQNQLTGMGANTLTFDNNGNTTTDDHGQALIYDAWNRLVTVKDSSGNVITFYACDGAGRRISENPTSGTQTDLYYSSQWQVLEERQNGNATAHYVWSPVYVDAMVVRDRDTDANGSLNERIYAVQDANFDVTALMAYDSGTSTWGIAQRYVYDSYGKVNVTEAGFVTTTDAFGWQNMHQGLRLNSDTGWYDNRNRIYSATMMRFGLQDPMGYIDGPNRFAFVGDNPINHLDPTGLTDKVSDTIMQGEYSGIKVSVDLEAQSSAGGHVHIGSRRTKFMWQPEVNKFEKIDPSIFKRLMSNQAFRAEMKAAIPRIKAVAARNKGTILCAAVVLTLTAAEVAQAAQVGGPQAALDTAIGEGTDFATDYAATLVAAPIVGAAASSLVTSSALASSTPALAAGGTTLTGGGIVASTGVGLAVMAAAGVGYGVGTGITQIPTGGGQNVSDRIGAAIYYVFGWAY